MPMGGATVQQTLTELVAKIGENMSVRRTVALAVDPGVVAAYVHNAASPELGKIGVLVALKSTADKAKLAALAKQLAMHVAAAAPLAHHARASVARRWWSASATCRPKSRASPASPENVIEKMMRRPDAQILRRDRAAVADLRDRRRNPGRQGDREAAKDIGAPVRSWALSASRWARASKRPRAILPTKSNKLAGR